MEDEQKLKELKQRYSAHLLGQKGVCAVGIENDKSGEPVLAIHLDDSAAEDLDLPEEFKDYAVKYVRQDGGFRKLSRINKSSPE